MDSWPFLALPIARQTSGRASGRANQTDEREREAQRRAPLIPNRTNELAAPHKLSIKLDRPNQCNSGHTFHLLSFLTFFFFSSRSRSTSDEQRSDALGSILEGKPQSEQFEFLTPECARHFQRSEREFRAEKFANSTGNAERVAQGS